MDRPVMVLLLILLAAVLLLLPRVFRLRGTLPLWGVLLAILGVGAVAILGIFGPWAAADVRSAVDALGVSALALAAALHLLALAHERSERANAQEQRRAEGLFQGAPEGIVVVDLDRRILDVNAAFSRMFGYPRSEVLGRLIDELLAPPDRVAEAREISRVVNAGGEINLDTVRRRKDGSLVEVAVLVNRFETAPGKYAIHGIYVDLTARKAAERRLRENEALLELFFAQSLDGFFFAMADAPIAWGRGVDRDAVLEWAIHHTRVTKMNEAMAHQYGAAAGQMLGRSIAQFFGERADDARQALRVLFDQGRSHAESLEQRLDGTTILIEGDYRLLQDDQGRVTGLFGIQRDITIRRRAEDEIRTSRRELRELAARLQSVREDERSSLAREVHDELGQLLTALKFEMAWLRDHLPLEEEGARARVDATVGLIAEGVGSVRRIITALRPSLLDDLGLVAALEWQVERFSERTGLAAHFDGPAAPVKVDPGQATALFRICQEALTNVARHAGARSVRVALHDIEGALILEVQDDGRGIGDPETNAAGSGRLGIVGMRERAIASGGSVSIHGAPGAGTTVHVIIPLAPSSPFPAVTTITAQMRSLSQ